MEQSLLFCSSLLHTEKKNQNRNQENFGFIFTLFSTNLKCKDNVSKDDYYGV